MWASFVLVAVVSFVWSEQRIGEVADELVSVVAAGLLLAVAASWGRGVVAAFGLALLGSLVQVGYAVAGDAEPRGLTVATLAAVVVGLCLMFAGGERRRAARRRRR